LDERPLSSSTTRRIFIAAGRTFVLVNGGNNADSDAIDRRGAGNAAGNRKRSMYNALQKELVQAFGL
jgi:hypothetical protein